MAIFNCNLISGVAQNGVYRAFCEEKTDMTSPACETWEAGSMIVCLNVSGDKKPTKHIKLPNGAWNEVTG